jgi:dihydrofolate reductase
MKVGLLVAIGQDNVIGVDGDLPWDCPKDRAMFKKLTMGNTIIVGTKTYQSLPRLEGRRIIVVTSNSISLERRWPEDLFAGNLTYALELAAVIGSPIAWVAGGIRLYDEAIRLGVLDFAVIGRVSLPVKEGEIITRFNPQLLLKDLKGLSEDSMATSVCSDTSYYMNYYPRLGVPPLIAKKVNNV